MISFVRKMYLSEVNFDTHIIVFVKFIMLPGNLFIFE